LSLEDLEGRKQYLLEGAEALKNALFDG
jgi:hypothetical protein